MKTIIIIPAYNAEKAIGEIIDQCLVLNGKVLVVDNNSKDNTLDIIRQSKASVVLETKQGQGAATRRGWQEAIETNYDIVITLDSDGQHNPKEIPSLLNIIKDNKVNIVIGARFINDYKAPVYRKFGIDIINYIYNVGYKKKLVDTQSCFRAYNKKAFTSLNIEENGFGFSTELLIKARKKGLRIVEVPVSCIYHDKREKNSTLNPVKHGLIVAWKTLYWRLKLWN
jgi:glycosyltransferase involved in cell wall biosynthesis